MGLSLCCTLSQDLEQLMDLEISGGCTQSVFPSVEKIVYGSTRVQKNLARIYGKKIGSKFRSIMDWFFCEVIGPPVWSHCMEFYHAEGLPAVERYTPRQIRLYEVRLLTAARLLDRDYTDSDFTKQRPLKETWASFLYEIQSRAV
jgi:hypothetical protein